MHQNRPRINTYLSPCNFILILQTARSDFQVGFNMHHQHWSQLDDSQTKQTYDNTTLRLKWEGRKFKSLRSSVLNRQNRQYIQSKKNVTSFFTSKSIRYNPGDTTTKNCDRDRDKESMKPQKSNFHLQQSSLPSTSIVGKRR